MTDFNAQSTNQINVTTNPYQSTVVLSGTVAMTNFALSGSWYSGTASVDFPLNTNYANLEVEAWIGWQLVGSSNQYTYFKMPHANYNGSAITSSSMITVTKSPRTGVYSVLFTFGINSPSLSTPIVYYRLKSDLIAAAGLTFV